MSEYYVYILASRSRTLYVGVTNDLQRRLHEHRDHSRAGFTSRYHVTRLVYFESTPDVKSAIEREKQIKSWSRRRKIELVESMNPTWLDLSEGWRQMQIPTVA
jgi:putative endonuclease